MKAAGARLNLATIIAFTAPSFAVAMLLAPVFSVLPAHYASHTKASMVAIGTIFLAARLSDAVLDPLVGYLSDRTRTRFGKRKPWIAAGTMLSVVSIYPLFVPPPDAGALYFLVWSMISYLGWTMIGVPSNAWAAEITGDYTERARIVTYANVFSTIGGMAFFLLPYLPIFPDTSVSQPVLVLAAWIMILSLPILMALSLWLCPVGEDTAVKPPALASDVRAILTNGPFHNVLLAYLLFGCGAGVFAAVLMLVLGDHFHIADKFSIISIVASVCHLAGTPFWFMLVKRIGKHRSWAIGTVIPLAVMPLALVIPTGPQSFIPVMIIIAASSFGFASGGIVNAMLADVIDYDALRTGQNRTASYYAIYQLATKACVAVGGGLGFVMLGLIGYKAGGHNSEFAKLWLLITFSVAPCLFYAAAMAVLWRYPISEYRQSVIRRRLETRASRARSLRVPQPAAIGLPIPEEAGELHPREA